MAVTGYFIYFLYQADALQLYKTHRLSFASLYFERGNYYFGGKTYDLDKALANYERAHEFRNYFNEPIHYQLGRVYFIKGDLAGAIGQFNAQLEENPEFKRTYYMRGLTYGYLDQYTKAAEDFKQFLAWKPNSWAAHNDLAWVYFRAGDFKNAEKIVREGFGQVEINPWLANTLGAVLINSKKYMEAEKYLLIAKEGFEVMSDADWGRAYPGNNPEVYAEGREATLQSVEKNLALVEQKKSSE